ncbi:MAG TPA: glycerol-3-phosphate 1-O-acyltransferase PlsY [Syntrophorhabdaceae bacterium]|jgi:glycerol-3-phosphate acyltransferase PlsY
MRSLLFIIAAYLIGSIPVGVILSKMKGKDPRSVGSGNIGATNVMRTAGKALGIITLIGDALKGYIPTFCAIHYGLPEYIIAAVGLAAFLGHLFPLFLGFKGGKGVATALGVYLALNPLAILGSFIVFLIVLLKWRYVSAGSIAGTVAMPFLLIALKAPAMYLYLSIVVTVMIVVKHRGNIRRLAAGTEHKLGSSKKIATGN